MKNVIPITSISYNKPEKLVQKDVNKSDVPSKDGSLSYLQSYLTSMKSGTKVFTQHLLASYNLSQQLEGTINEFVNAVMKTKIFFQIRLTRTSS